MRLTLAVAAAATLAAPAALAQQGRFEPNQTRRTAAKLQPGDHRTILCNEEDWFELQVPRGQRLEVSAAFQHDKGDLELALHDRAGKLVAWSRGTQDEESLAFDPAAAATLYLRVHGADGGDGKTTNVYDLHVGLAPSTFAGPGAAVSANGWGADWYPLQVEQGKELRATLAFRHAEGDLDLKLFDDEGNELASAEGQGDEEALRWRAPAARTVLLLVKSPQRGRSGYTLRASIEAPALDDLPRVLRRDRPAGKGQDVLELTNGDVLKGTILNETFRLATAYTEVDLAAARVAGVDLEKNRTELEVVHTVDGNRLSGFLRTVAFRFRMEGIDQPVEIRRERVKCAIFGARGGERAGFERHQYVSLKNGDHFGARVVKADLVLDTGFARIPLQLAQLDRIQFDLHGGVNVVRLNDTSTRGRLNLEDLELELDIAAGAGRTFKVHPDRVDVLYCQAGFIPDSPQSGGAALTFDFEEGLDPWVAQGTPNTSWTHHASEGVRGEGCVRACGPNGGPYADNAGCNLTSLPLPLAGMTAPTLRFQVKTRLERGPDLFVVRLSYDQGQTFTEVHRVTGDNEWTNVALPLQAGAAEVVIQFGLTSDGSVVSQGVWLDAVEVGEPAPPGGGR